MADRLDDRALAQIFTEARTHRSWAKRDVPDALLEELTKLMLWGPTAFNLLPARIVYVKSAEAKERLRPFLSPANVDKTMTAPVCAIVAQDMRFYENVPKGMEPMPALGEKPEVVAAGALRNSSLQGGYFMLAARALGLDVGAMSGFNSAGVDAAFFEGTSIKSNFLCNIGYGDGQGLRPRGPRFTFGEIARIV